MVLLARDRGTTRRITLTRSRQQADDAVVADGAGIASQPVAEPAVGGVSGFDHLEHSIPPHRYHWAAPLALKSTASMRHRVKVPKITAFEEITPTRRGVPELLHVRRQERLEALGSPSG